MPVPLDSGNLANERPEHKAAKMGISCRALSQRYKVRRNKTVAAAMEMTVNPIK